MRGRRQPDGFFTYLVGWDADLVIKAGVTMRRQRWGSFVARGATLYQLHNTKPGSGLGWVALETQVDIYLARTLAPAFANKADAARSLGNQGGGYLECFRADDEATYRDALAACSRIMLAHDEAHCRFPMPTQMHGRTDAHTYLEPHSPNAINLKFSNVRACKANEGNGVVK